MNKRYTKREPVRSTCMLSSDGKIEEGLLVNLSVPGCMLKTSMKLRVGQYVDLRLSFATGQNPLQIKLAAVRWVKDGMAGIEFIRMSEADQAQLRSLAGYVEKHRAQQIWSERVVCMGASLG